VSVELFLYVTSEYTVSYPVIGPASSIFGDVGSQGPIAGFQVFVLIYSHLGLPTDPPSTHACARNATAINGSERLMKYQGKKIG
jgi:hypothetical protein